MRFGIMELLIILIIVLLIIGPRQLPKLIAIFKEQTKGLKKKDKKNNDSAENTDIKEDV